MTYVYRDPGRLRGRPVHVPEDVPEPAPAAVVQPIELSPTPRPPVKACRPPAKPNPRPLPPPVWGGAAGLKLAAAESAALDIRTTFLAESGATSEWIREFKRTRNIH